MRQAMLAAKYRAQYSFKRATGLRRGFTLIELLTVIAISTIILFLLFGPIIQSFNLTRRARAISQAQSAARLGIERMTREIGSASYIYDNSLVRLTLPLENPDRLRANDGLTVTNDPATWPQASNARIDFVPQATFAPAGAIDPTTGGPYGGADIRPLTRGSRVVRYFLAPRDSFERNADGSIRRGAGDIPILQFYKNRYEFNDGPGKNIIVLWRAEFDPRDPNLFDLANYTSGIVNDGGFNDPNFFYNTVKTGPNLKTFAENWREVSAPVLTAPDLDLIAWNRDRNKNIVVDNPFSPGVQFTPNVIIGDTATPGFLTTNASEVPNAVPTLYTAKYGQWTFPYKITFVRGSSQYTGTARTPEPFGTLEVNVRMGADGLPKVTTAGTASTLPSTSTTDTYAALSPTTGKLFVKTPNLTFIVDPARGRVETGIAPLMGDAAGAPSILQGGTVSLMQPVGNLTDTPQMGELVPTRFIVSTRYPTAGTGDIPNNQGIWEVNLLTDSYASVDAVAGTLTNYSPLEVFGVGTGNAARGIMVAPGTEQVFAPDSYLDGASLVSYSRLPAMESLESGLAQKTGGTYTNIPARPRAYVFDYDLFPVAGDPLQALLIFDATPTWAPVDGLDSPGLPADTVVNVTKVLQATYLWQNNFSRNPATGEPLAANATPILDASTTQPEGDVVKVDYATRSVMNISLAARVYDASSAQPYNINVSDKVQVNNVGR